MGRINVHGSQQLLSQKALGQIRALEGYLHLQTGLDRTLEQALYRAPQAPIGTPERRHKIIDRADRKRQARWIGLFRFYRPDAFRTGDYRLI